LRRSFAGSPNEAGVGNRYKSFRINRLVGKCNKIARPHTRFGRDEKAARCSFKDTDADYIADAKRDLGRGAMVPEGAGKTTRSKLLQGLDNLGCELDKPIWRTVPGLAGPDNNGIGTRGRQQIAAATGASQCATNDRQLRKRPQCPQRANPPTSTKGLWGFNGPHVQRICMRPECSAPIGRQKYPNGIKWQGRNK
jgi:hypothetical protein